MEPYNELKTYRILIVDDEEGIRYGLKNILERSGYESFEAATGEKALEIIRNSEIDLVLLDIKLKHMSGLDVLTSIRTISTATQVIIVTGYGTIDSAVAAMQRGACDYILKPIEKKQILHSVERALSRKKIEDENFLLRNELSNQHAAQALIAKGTQMQNIISLADQIKDSDCNVLISGETGSGKEVIAEYIHAAGNRNKNNFVTVNCASLSQELLSSELFGHVKGSFTGAIEHKLGKCDLAHGGTLFLDEIGEMPVSIQVMLLRLIEEKCFERVGGVKKIHTDIRLIAATNRTLEDMVEQGLFREDLYYRIHVIRLHVPPLRDRPDDILPLAEHYLKKYACRYHKKISRFSQEASSLLKKYSWPGNVRELMNIIHRAVLLSPSSIIGVEDFTFSGSPVSEMEALKDVGTLKERMEPIISRYESKILSETLKKHGGNKSRAAEELGITRQTLLTKLRHVSIG